MAAAESANIKQAIRLLDSDIENIQNGAQDGNLVDLLSGPFKDSQIVKQVQSKLESVSELNTAIEAADRIVQDKLAEWEKENEKDPGENDAVPVEAAEQSQADSGDGDPNNSTEEINEEDDGASRTSKTRTRGGRIRKPTSKVAKSEDDGASASTPIKTSGSVASTQSNNTAPKRRGRPPKKKPMGRPRKRPPSPSSGDEVVTAKRPPGRPRKHPVAKTGEEVGGEDTSQTSKAIKEELEENLDDDDDDDDDVPIAAMAEAHSKAKSQIETKSEDTSSKKGKPSEDGTTTRKSTPAKRSRTTKQEKGESSSRATRSGVKRKSSPAVVRERSKRTRSSKT